MALGVSRSRVMRAYLASGVLIGLVAGIAGAAMSLGITEVFILDYTKALGLSLVLPHWHEGPVLLLVLGQSLAFALITRCCRSGCRRCRSFASSRSRPSGSRWICRGR